MAIIYRCDRCFKESKDDNNLTRIELEYETKFNYGSNVIIKTNICPDCLRKMKTWLDPDGENNGKNTR